MSLNGTQERQVRLWLAVMVLIAGCGPTQEPPSTAAPPGALASTAQAMNSENGFSVNGLSFNGLSFNGLSFNGLSFNGLSTSAFADWFHQDPAFAQMVMRYVVRCAVPEGQTRTYTDASSGQQYTWTGGLGLAPSWAGGAPATLIEQQVVSACLAAHANKYGQHVPISVQGKRADGSLLPVTDEELKQFKWKESCFFGNLFTGEGVYVGSDTGRLKPRESSSRACSVVASRGDMEDELAEELGSENSSPDVSRDDSSQALELDRLHCAPLGYVGRCARHCVLDESKAFFAACTQNGVTYPALTTRLDKHSLYRCGDGICQPTESCGEKNDYLSCKDDCGTCG